MKRRRQTGSASRVTGQALVPVLFVVVLLVLVAVGLTTLARREVRAGEAQLRHARMLFVARGAVVYAAAQLQAASSGGAVLPEIAQPPDTDANGWTQLGDGWYKIDITDTASRLNINLATAEGLAKLPGIASDPALAVAIVDWRDADDTPGSMQGYVGAESEYYTALATPYSPKNAAFDTVDELLLVRGVTPTVLYGTRDASGAAIALDSAASRQADAGTGDPVDVSASTMPLVELLTTYSKERNVASDGSARINIKTAGAEELTGTLGLPAALAQRLIQARGQNGANLNSIADLLGVVGFTRQIMQQIGDKITVTDGQDRPGMVNINTAPAEVLATIPGVDQTIYNAVIEARQGGTVFAGLNDLFQLTALNRQQLQALVDSVCTKSSVYLVRLKVRVRGSRETRAFQALVEVMPPTTQDSGQGDGSTTTVAVAPRILQFREVGRSPGWSSWSTGVFGPGGTIGVQ